MGSRKPEVLPGLLLRVKETKRFSCWSAQRVAKESNTTTQSHFDALNEVSMVLSVNHIVFLVLSIPGLYSGR